MAFPTSPTDGQTYTNSNGTVFQYDSSEDRWFIIVTSLVRFNSGTSFPSNPTEDQLFWREDLETLYVFSTDAQAWIDVSSGSGSEPIIGGKNVIINGDMRIAQRGTSFASAGSNVYILDRWNYRKATTSAVHTVTQDSDTPNDQFNYSLKLDCTTADASVDANDFIAIRQRVEGYNFRKFVGQQGVLSYWVKAGKTGTMCVSFKNDGVDRSYVVETTIDVANTWEKKSVTLDFDYTGGTWDYTNGTGIAVTFAMLAGSTFQTTADAWQSGNYTATSNQTNFVDNTDSTCDVWITGVQLELGANDTEFEFVDHETQLSQCQRYYEKSYNYGSDPGSTGAAGRFDWYIYYQTTGNIWMPIEFNTRKRTNPTIRFWDGAGNLNRISLWGPTANNQGGTTQSIGEHGFAMRTNSGNSKRGFYCHWDADAEL